MLFLTYLRALLCSSPILQSKIQAQRHDETCPWSHNQEIVELGFRSSCVRFQSSQRLFCSVLMQAPVLCTHREPPPLPGGTCLHKRVTHNSPFPLPPGPHLLVPVSGPLHAWLLLPEIHSPLGLPHPLGVSSNVTSSEKPSELQQPPHPLTIYPITLLSFLYSTYPCGK